MPLAAGADEPNGYGRGDDANPMALTEDEQVRIAGDDQMGARRQGAGDDLIVVWIAGHGAGDGGDRSGELAAQERFRQLAKERPTGVELDCRCFQQREDGLGCAAPEQRRNHYIRVNDQPHAVPCAPRSPLPGSRRATWARYPLRRPCRIPRGTVAALSFVIPGKRSATRNPELPLKKSLDSGFHPSGGPGMTASMGHLAMC